MNITKIERCDIIFRSDLPSRVAYFDIPAEGQSCRNIEQLRTIRFKKSSGVGLFHLSKVTIEVNMYYFLN